MAVGRPLLLAVIVCGLFVQRAAAADPKQIYQESTDALYNLDFSTAQHGYEVLTRDYPDNPDYWNALASSIWLKITFDQQKLDMESFSAKATFGTKESKEAVDPADEKRLRDTLDIAVKKADAILQKNPNDIRALYAKGISSATLASFEGTVKRSYLSAHGKAKTARDLHERVLKLDPAFDDARMSIGTYNYVVSVIPGVIRLFLGIFGIRSAGKDVGIQQLETAAAKGKFAATDAKMVLVVVYNREQRYDQALRLLEELHSSYPRNFLFEMSTGSIYGKMKRPADAARTYEQVLGKVQAKKDGYERLREGKVYYSLGTSEVDAYQFEKALDTFSHVVSVKDSTPDEKGGGYLWMGKILDSRKDRARALQQYDAVLGLNCDPGLKEEAQKYRRRPFGS